MIKHNQKFNISYETEIEKETAIDIFNFVLTKAAPFPGFTCWNSTTLNTFPSISNVVPFLKSPAEYTAAIINLLSNEVFPLLSLI